MSRSRSRLAADWFAKLRLNEETDKVEHLDVTEEISNSSMAAADIITEVKTVDGSGSGLDADTVDGIQGSSIVTKTDNQALHDTDALRISGSTLYLYKGDGGNESVALPSSVPTAGQVGSATAGLSVGGVGTYAVLRKKNTAADTINPGTTRAGSLFYFGSFSTALYATSPLPAGTWKAMGKSDGYNGTVWLRIA